jgi:hypothetical protein
MKEYVQSKFDNFFCIFASNPSAKMEGYSRRYMSEIEKGICFNGTGTAFMLEIPDLP